MSAAKGILRSLWTINGTFFASFRVGIPIRTGFIEALRYPQQVAGPDQEDTF
jgi:hypothetical protein